MVRSSGLFDGGGLYGSLMICGSSSNGCIPKGEHIVKDYLSK
jgi:hypothetical protein